MSELLIHFYVSISHHSKKTGSSFTALYDKNVRIQKKLQEKLVICNRKKDWIKANASTLFSTGITQPCGFTKLQH